MNITCKQCNAVHTIDFKITKCLNCGSPIVTPDKKNVVEIKEEDIINKKQFKKSARRKIF